jgi:hypothetical protein
MKDAKTMFEKLGYRQLETLKPDDGYIVIAYEKEIYGEKEYIYFYGAEEVRVYLEDRSGRIYPPIVELEELQAINKQVEELGWLRGEDNDKSKS